MQSGKRIIIEQLSTDGRADGKSRLVASVTVHGTPWEIWYEADKRYLGCWCTERIDGVVVNLLPYAMEHGLGFCSEIPISAQLYYQLNEYLVPAISRNIGRYSSITIDAPVSSEPLWNQKAVGASISGGVDSFYTLFRHLGRKEKGYSISHLCFFNAGASGAFGGDKARKLYRERIHWMKSVSDELGLEMVCVDTNVNEFIREGHQATHTFRTLSIPLLMQKLFCKYYFASGEEFKDFAFSENDTAAYDLLTTRCLGNENIAFYVSGGEKPRIDKVREIADHKITYAKLNVCTSQAANCGKCDKCARTLMELYALNKLDRYAAAFDVPYFYKHKRSYFARMVAFKGSKDKYGGYDWADVYELCKNEVSAIDWMYGIAYRVYRFLRHRLYRNAAVRKLYDRYKNT